MLTITIYNGNKGRHAYGAIYLFKTINSRFYNAQIYKLISFAPHFLKSSRREQCTILNHFIQSHHKNNKKLAIVCNLFSTLHTENILDELAKNKVEFIDINNARYSSLLREIAYPPVILFYRGNVDFLNYRAILGVIGSRNATHYTEQSLHYLYPSFQQQKIAIVSGLAKGADHIALKLGIQYQLPTIAVLGFGHRKHYPTETLKTRKQIESHGLVISEYPPHTGIKKYYFPQRNRLISGIAKGVLITESEAQSGTQITIESALDQNREVYIVPGRIFDPLSKGNMLAAQQGAKIVIHPEDIIEDFKKSL